VGDGEKLLTYLNSVLKVLSGLDIFSRGTKKSEILLTSVIRYQLWAKPEPKDKSSWRNSKENNE
jgi:hypothetical protein